MKLLPFCFTMRLHSSTFAIFCILFSFINATNALRADARGFSLGLRIQRTKRGWVNTSPNPMLLRLAEGTNSNDENSNSSTQENNNTFLGITPPPVTETNKPPSTSVSGTKKDDNPFTYTKILNFLSTGAIYLYFGYLLFDTVRGYLTGGGAGSDVPPTPPPSIP